jgi:hypothetical protein
MADAVYGSLATALQAARVGAAQGASRRLPGA